MPQSSYEVFNPRNGTPLFRTRFAVIAQFVAWLRGLDYAATGEGWLSEPAATTALSRITVHWCFVLFPTGDEREYINALLTLREVAEYRADGCTVVFMD